MKKYVTPNDMKKIEGVKGTILKEQNGVVLVKTDSIYSVWNPEDGFSFCNTFDAQEAEQTFEKYKG